MTQDNPLLQLSLMFVPVLLAITCHEVAHGYVAWRFGDPTARMLGRLTLNPLKHIDLMGTIIVPLLLVLSHTGILFGWAKPVPVVIENLRNPKKDMIWVAVAGPITNVLLALFSMILLIFVSKLPFGVLEMTTGLKIVDPITTMLVYSIHINVLLFVLNMLPIPPLDGGRVLIGLLPDKQASKLASIEKYGLVILIFLVFILPKIGAGDILRSISEPITNFIFKMIH